MPANPVYARLYALLIQYAEAKKVEQVLDLQFDKYNLTKDGVTADEVKRIHISILGAIGFFVPDLAKRIELRHKLENFY